MSDNTSNCVVGGSHCWKQFSTGLKIFPWSGAMAVTAEGQAFAVGTDERLYQYTNVFQDRLGDSHTAGAWQLFSSAPTGTTGINSVAATSSADIYSSTYPVGALYHYNGTSWTSVGIKANLVSEGSDGTVYIQTADTSNKLETLSNGTWKQVSYPPGHGYIYSLSVGAQDNVWLIMKDRTLWLLDPSSGTFKVVAPPSGTTQPVIVATSGGSSGSETWLVTANDGTVTNNVFLYNNSTGGWTPMIGLLTNIATVGHGSTVGSRTDARQSVFGNLVGALLQFKQDTGK